MTGKEFDQLREESGHDKTSLAKLWGMTRQAITNYCKADVVPPVYAYAIKAVIYEKQAAKLAGVIKIFNETSSTN